MKFARFLAAGCLSLCRVHGDVADVQFSASYFQKMTTHASSTESCSDWKHVKCSRDELRLDVTLASGQSFRSVQDCDHSAVCTYLSLQLQLYIICSYIIFWKKIWIWCSLHSFISFSKCGFCRLHLPFYWINMVQST